jgi:hypothetical protein
MPKMPSMSSKELERFLEKGLTETQPGNSNICEKKEVSDFSMNSKLTSKNPKP